jgi:hypothetical protein
VASQWLLRKRQLGIDDYGRDTRPVEPSVASSKKWSSQGSAWQIFSSHPKPVKLRAVASVKVLIRRDRRLTNRYVYIGKLTKIRFVKRERNVGKVLKGISKLKERPYKQGKRAPHEKEIETQEK